MRKSTSQTDRRYTNSDIAVMAVYRWGGALRHVHLEDVAMKAAELSPRRFSWKKYPDQINLEAVRVAMKDELSSGNSRLIGGIRDGYMLTPSGLSWCISTTETGDDQALLDLVHKEVDRVKKTTAFVNTLNGRGQDVSVADVEALLRVNEYTTPRNRRERAAALANAALVDSQLRSVLANLRKRGFDQLEVRR